MVFGPSKTVCPQVVLGLASGVVLRNERNDKHNVQSTSNNRNFHINNASCNNRNNSVIAIIVIITVLRIMILQLDANWCSVGPRKYSPYICPI